MCSGILKYYKEAIYETPTKIPPGQFEQASTSSSVSLHQATKGERHRNAEPHAHRTGTYANPSRRTVNHRASIRERDAGQVQRRVGTVHVRRVRGTGRGGVVALY